MLFKVTTDEANTRAAARRADIVNEVNGLIRGSRWQNMVSPDKFSQSDRKSGQH